MAREAGIELVVAQLAASQGSARGGLAPLLAGLRERFAARALAWIPDGGARPGPHASGPRAALRTCDLGLARRLAPGRERCVERPWAPGAVRAPEDGWAAHYARARDGGVLFVLGRPGAAPAGALVAWADLLARLDARLAAGAARAASARELAAGRRAAAAAHDLRNQLTLAGLLCRRAAASAGRGGFLDELDDVLASAREIAAQTLLDAEPEPRPKPLVLRTVLMQAARESAAVARSARRGARVLVRCPVRLRVHVDPEELARLVRNLVTNAVEASFDGGEVRLEGRRAADGCVELGVEDAGRGMDAAGVRALFSGGASRSGGTGFGGSSLLAVAERLSAELEVASAPGRGTRVRVRLPAGADGPLALVVDGDGRRRARRVAALSARGTPAIGLATPERALQRWRSSAVSEVHLARGTPGAGLAELRAKTEREGAPLHVYAARLSPHRSAPP